MSHSPPAPHPESTRRVVGLLLYALGMLVGAGLLIGINAYSMIGSEDLDRQLTAMSRGALFAVPMLAVYLGSAWLVDRYDPEPAWALVLVLSWGAVGACGLSLAVNETVRFLGDALGGPELGEILSACLSAPVVEELTKGLAVFFMFYVMRREFDGLVDGVIYATFVALGFATVENILYYGSAIHAEMLGNQGSLAGTFIVRGILAPWGHPLYTSMTGLGFGVAREARSAMLRWVAPVVGYLCAVFLHATWNMAATLSGALLVLMFPLWMLFLMAFVALVAWLIWRKGTIIRDYLRDEVMMGTLTQWELGLVASPVGAVRATFTFGGRAGRRFVATASRLALSKWHAERAREGSRGTVSSSLILPLRRDLGRLREEISRRLGRAVEQPRGVTPGATSGSATAVADAGSGRGR